MAAAHGMDRLLATFVEKGQDMNAVNEDSENALISAVANGRLETVRVLLALGVDTTVTTAEPHDAEGKPSRNAIQVAEAFGADEIAHLLRTHQQQLQQASGN